MHLAGFQVEAHAIDAIEVRAGYADKARVIRVIDGMDFAILVDASMARCEPVFFHRLEFGVFGIAAVILALPFGHVGVMGRLPVNRPRRAVIVRRRVARLVVDVSQHLEAEVGILIENVKSARRLFSMRANKIGIPEQGLELGANLLAAFWSWVER